MSRWLLFRSCDLASIVSLRGWVVPRSTSLFRSKIRCARCAPSTSSLQCSMCCFEEGASCSARRSERSTALKSRSCGSYVGPVRACRPHVCIASLCLHLVASDQVGASTCANLQIDQVAFVARNMINAMPLVVFVFVSGLIVPRSDHAERSQREGSAQHRPPLIFMLCHPRCSSPCGALKCNVM